MVVWPLLIAQTIRHHKYFNAYTLAWIIPCYQDGMISLSCFVLKGLAPILGKSVFFIASSSTYILSHMASHNFVF